MNEMLLTDWWVRARLCLVPGDGGDLPDELARGPLAEMIARAVDTPVAEQSKLLIISDAMPIPIAWPEIVALAARVDCPIFI
jgi:hypothetical protein